MNIGLDFLSGLQTQIIALLTSLKTPEGMQSLLFPIAAILLAWAIGLFIRRKLTPFLAQESEPNFRQHCLGLVAYLISPILSITALTFVQPLVSYPIATIFLKKICIVWLLIRLVGYITEDHILTAKQRRFAWFFGIIYALGALDPVVQVLSSVEVPIGETRLSIYNLLQGLVLFALYLWGANLFSRGAEKQYLKMPRLSSSLQVLLGKLTKFALFAIAALMGLKTLGIDLSTFAMLGGAIGLGLGFGLQKIISNFISGIILLSDRSIKPGDVIKVDETYGWVNSLSARYASVITRDGKEHLIPNEMLITEKVENWSYSNKNIRIKIPVGIAYTSDVNLAMQIMMGVAESNKRILSNPKPNCLLMEFGDSSVNLELRVWISDPSNGLANVRSEIQLAIWEAFNTQGVEFPYPQQDIYIKELPKKV